MMNKIEEKFKILSLNESLIVLKKDDAKNFIEECEKENICILGIDAYYINGKYIQPVLEKSIDFTSYQNRKQTNNNYALVRKHIDEQNEDLSFEITCE